MATSSNPLRLFGACLLLGLAGVPAVQATVFHTQKEAPALAFPEAERFETVTRILSAEQVNEIQSLARAKMETRIAKFYVGYRGEQILGYAYIDIHEVRTLPEAFMVVLTPEGEVSGLHVLAFHEPLDYLPHARWLGQFEAATLARPLRLGRDVHGIAGSTLSSRAVTQSVRRVLALYQVLIRAQPKEK